MVLRKQYDPDKLGFHPTILLDGAHERRRTFETESRWNWTDIPEHLYASLHHLNTDAAAKHEKPIAIDCWKYDNDQNEPCKSEIRYIDDESIESWAKQRVSNQDGKPPRAGLRLLHICSERFPFPKEILAAVSKAFGIPRVDLPTASQSSGVCARVYSLECSDPVFVCRAPFSMLSVTSVIRYDSKSNTTLGYILSGPASRIHLTLTIIPSQFDVCEHPLMIPVLMTEQSLDVANSLLSDTKKNLGLVEEPIKRGELSQRRERQNGNGEWLSSVTRQFAVCKAFIYAIGLRNSFLIEQLDSDDTWMPIVQLQNAQNGTLLLKQRLAYSRSNVDHLKVDSGVELRLDALKALVFNLIAQQDNQTNILISRDMRKLAIKAKNDGSIMKLVAILGTIFLPSTFVSTLFAMPLFNWNAPTASGVVGDHFWVYWAFTAPLTLLTMLLVGAWIRMRNRPVTDDYGDYDLPTEPAIDTRNLGPLAGCVTPL